MECGSNRPRTERPYVPELKLERNALPRVESDYIHRPDSSVIDVRGKGYYVERGVVYKKNGTPIQRLEDGIY